MLKREREHFSLFSTCKPLKDLSKRLLHAIQIDETFEVTSILRANKELAKGIILTFVYIHNFGDGTALHAAAYLGHKDIVRIFLKLEIDVNTRDTRNRIALHAASVGGLVTMVDYLIKENSEIDSRDRWGQTPLHKACSHGFTEVALLLIKKGAHPDSTDNYGRTPLDLAVLMNNYNTVETLTKKFRHNSKEKKSDSKKKKGDSKQRKSDSNETKSDSNGKQTDQNKKNGDHSQESSV
ncbi:unnamed protein product [Owenia fusiformis]|uniref:Uncharacterized protein n=1 Tax=Owenia fusiformis TaxID=6347 RepID=A0A8J1TSY6_OWEFU|nr:unnamed protein product [Owenia fusiformis]